MNSKERIQRTLARQMVDRIPIGFFAIDFDTVEKILGHETYLRAKAKSQIAFWEGRRDEVAQSWREDLIALHKKLDILDIISADTQACGLLPPKDYVPEPIRQVDENTWEARDGRVWKYSSVTADLTQVYTPPKTFSLEQFNLDEIPQPPDSSVFEVVDAATAEFPDHYILGPSGGEAGMIYSVGWSKACACMPKIPNWCSTLSITTLRWRISTTNGISVPEVTPVFGVMIFQLLPAHLSRRVCSVNSVCHRSRNACRR